MGGRAQLIQTGDIVDRGPNSTALIDLFARLRDEAEAAGGSVTCLLGNHELMVAGSSSSHCDIVSVRRLTDSQCMCVCVGGMHADLPVGLPLRGARGAA